MSRDEFYGMPSWKQAKVKKEVGLFWEWLRGETLGATMSASEEKEVERRKEKQWCRCCIRQPYCVNTDSSLSENCDRHNLTNQLHLVLWSSHHERDPWLRSHTQWISRLSWPTKLKLRLDGVKYDVFLSISNVMCMFDWERNYTSTARWYAIIESCLNVW